MSLKTQRSKHIDWEETRKRFLYREERINALEDEALRLSRYNANVGDSEELKYRARDHIHNTQINAVRNANMWAKFGDTWREHAVANRKFIRSSIDRPWPKKLVSPAHLIIGAGPGLDKEIENIRMIKREGLATIWCVDMALHALRVQGIKPDVVVSCDFHTEHVPKMLLAYKSVTHPPCVFFPQSPPEAVRRYKGQRLFAVGVDMIGELGKLVPEVHALPPYPSHGTVSGMALMMARNIGGCVTKMVGIVGNDLSYPIEGENVSQYCKHTIRANQPDGRSVHTKESIAIGDNGGEEVIIEMRNEEGEFVGEHRIFTTPLMTIYAESFRKVFEAEPQVAAQQKRDPVIYVNTTRSVLDAYSATNAKHGSLMACKQFISLPMQNFIAGARKLKELRKRNLEGKL